MRAGSTRLPEDLQKLVRDSAKEVFAEQRTLNRAETAKTLERDSRRRGSPSYNLSDTPKWREATESLYAEFGAKSPATKAMIDKIRALAG